MPVAVKLRVAPVFSDPSLGLRGIALPAATLALVALAHIAADVGYESESTFSRAFTREMGVAPGAWRKSGRIPAATRSAPERA
mgnify:CR=1 FL=1